MISCYQNIKIQKNTKKTPTNRIINVDQIVCESPRSCPLLQFQIFLKGQKKKIGLKKCVLLQIYYLSQKKVHFLQRGQIKTTLLVLPERKNYHNITIFLFLFPLCLFVFFCLFLSFLFCFCLSFSDLKLPHLNLLWAHM